MYCYESGTQYIKDFGLWNSSAHSFQDAIFFTMEINMIKYSIGNGCKPFPKEIVQVKLEYVRKWTFFFTLSLKRLQITTQRKTISYIFFSFTSTLTFPYFLSSAPKKQPLDIFLVSCFSLNSFNLFHLNMHSFYFSSQMGPKKATSYHS